MWCAHLPSTLTGNVARSPRQAHRRKPCRRFSCRRTSPAKPTLVTITSARLTYTDNERIAHFESGVVAKADDANMTANAMDVFLQARGPTGGQPDADGNNVLGKVGQLDKIVAKGQVVVTQPNRRATCEQMVYTAAEDKFVLTGGTPSIFDAEHGKITGVSLTFFRRDDRVLVEGNGASPTVTQTRVAR
jgi:lipopolysaccharide export system protein LptA